MAKSKLQSARREPTSTANMYLEEVHEAESEAKAIKETKKPGRKATAEPIKMVGFKFPVSRIEELKKLAGIAGMNSTQYLLKLIAEDAEKKKDLMAAIAKTENRG